MQEQETTENNQLLTHKQHTQLHAILTHDRYQNPALLCLNYTRHKKSVLFFKQDVNTNILNQSSLTTTLDKQYRQMLEILTEPESDISLLIKEKQPQEVHGTSQSVAIKPTDFKNDILFLLKKCPSKKEEQKDHYELKNLLSEMTTLNLVFQQLGNSGTSRIANAIIDNTTLIDLNLCFNDIGDMGALSLSEMLRVNTTLISLTLIHNKIGDVGASVLACILINNTTLTHLDLSFNKIRNKIMDKIDNLMTRNRKLRDRCIKLLKQGELVRAQTLLENNVVNANGVLLKLVNDYPIQLKPIQRLFQVVQSSADQKNIISRGTILKAINRLEFIENPLVVDFLQSHLVQISNMTEAKVGQLQISQENRTYPSPYCIIT